MINKLGLYVQENGDVGDAAHRSGTAVALLGLLGEKQQAWELLGTVERNLELGMSGLYIRHPGGYEPEWSDNPMTFSRDQASRIILGYAVLGYKSGIQRWFNSIKARYFTHQNHVDPTTGQEKFPDVMAPGEFRNLIRGLDLWYLYPILILLDSLFLFDIAFRKKWDGGTLIIPDIYYACKKYPTGIGHLAKFVASKTKIKEEILNNHSIENNGCVELKELFKKLYKE